MSIRGRLSWSLVLPLLVLAFGFVATFGVWRLVRTEGEARLALAFQSRSQGLVRLFSERLHDDEQILRGARGLFSASDRVDRGEWRRYVETLDLRARYPGIQGVGYTLWIPAVDRERVVRQHRAEGFKEFDIRPEGVRTVYTAITFLEPFDWRNQRAFGFDMYSEATRREAMDRAMRTGDTAMSGPVTLVQETDTDRQVGVLMYIPVYRNGSPLVTPEDRERAIAGFVYSPIRVTSFIFGTLESLPTDLGFRLRDGEGDLSILFSSLEPNEEASVRGRSPVVTLPLSAYGRTWELTIVARPAFMTLHRNHHVGLILWAGGSMSLLLAIGVWALLSGRERAIRAAREARKARQWMALHIERTPLAVIEWDQSSRVVSWNPAAERIFGFSRADAIGLPYEALLPESRRGGKFASGVGSDPVTLPQGLHENLARDGRLLHCEWFNTTLIDSEGRAMGAASLVSDVTERRRLETRLRDAQKLESLGVLAGGVAHDFSNLLTGILGNIGLAMAHAAGDGVIEDTLGRAEKGCERAAELTRQMLAYSGRGRFVVEMVDLGLVAEDLAQVLRSSIARTSRVVVDVGSGIPRFKADVTQIRQVLMNLIVNASEALGGAPGEIRVRVFAKTFSLGDFGGEKTGTMDRPGECVCLEVSDTGCGMPSDVVDRMFDPFFSTKFAGRGLGLAATLGIIRGHQGGIWVVSVPGRGTTITVAFPAESLPG